MQERQERKDDSRIAVIETILQTLDKKIDTLTIEIKKYNGTRERLDSCQKELSEHKGNHWQTTTLAVAVFGIVVAIVVKFL